MKWKVLAAVAVLASVGASQSACAPRSSSQGVECGDGKGHWIEDESDSLSKGYTVIVRLCIDDGGNVLDLEVE